MQILGKLLSYLAGFWWKNNGSIFDENHSFITAHVKIFYSASDPAGSVKNLLAWLKFIVI